MTWEPFIPCSEGFCSRTRFIETPSRRISSTSSLKVIWNGVITMSFQPLDALDVGERLDAEVDADPPPPEAPPDAPPEDVPPPLELLTANLLVGPPAAIPEIFWGTVCP